MASSLQDWLKDRFLAEETATEVEKLAETRRTGAVKVDHATIPKWSPMSREPVVIVRGSRLPPAAKMPRGEGRRSKYVELPGAIFRLRKSGRASGCWMGRRREFRNCQKFPGLPDKSEYTHVCRLCWPSGGEGEDSAGDTSGSWYLVSR